MMPNFRVWDKLLEILRPAVFIDFVAEEAAYWFDEDTESYCPFKECILMQSTGLKDKNGKEIYEGDIILWKDLETFNDFKIYEVLKVEYSNEFLKWTAVDKDGLQSDLYDFSDNRELEVIGNIYENPKLLEVENE